MIPPGMIGHTTDVEKYTFNVARAKQLLGEAGYANGFRVNVVYEPRAAGAIDTLAGLVRFR